MGQVKNLSGENPKSELALPVLKPSGIGETRELSLAIQSRKINDSTIQEITQILRLVMMKLGIRGHNLPSNEERMVLLEHLCKAYGNHTLEEVKLAFDMAMIGKLDGDFKCYENFSCDYVSLVMKAYRAWSKEEFKQLPSPPPPAPIEENLSHYAMLRWLAREINFVKTGKPFEFVPLDLYEYFDKRGAFKASAAEKFEYLGKAAAWRAGQLQKEADRKGASIDQHRSLEKFREMRKNDNFSKDEFEKLKTIAKKLLFFDLAMKSK